MILLRKSVNRRRFLRGMMGGSAVAVGLPFLDCFLNSNGDALAGTSAPLPLNFGSFYWELGLTPNRWEPKATGKITETLGPELASLEPFKDKINIFSGMKLFLDGKTYIMHFHGCEAVFTGSLPLAQDGSGEVTLDQLIANAIGTRTRFRSLEVTAFGSATDTYSRRASKVMNPAETSPIALYTRIFGPEFKDPNAADFTPDPRLMLEQSVISAVKDQRHDFERNLDASSKIRLDAYFTSLRQLEQQLAVQLEKPAPLASCRVPEKVTEEGELGAEIEAVTLNNKLFSRILAHALACGQTQVVSTTFSKGIVGGLRRVGSAVAHHTLTHEEAVDQKLGYQIGVAWYNERIIRGFADTVGIFDEFKEGGGSLLDRTLLLGFSETGLARIHSQNNIPMITAGRAGGRIKTGMHIAAADEPVTRLGLTIQQAFGVPISKWGDGSMSTTKTITDIVA